MPEVIDLSTPSPRGREKKVEVISLLGDDTPPASPFEEPTIVLPIYEHKSLASEASSSKPAVRKRKGLGVRSQIAPRVKQPCVERAIYMSLAEECKDEQMRKNVVEMIKQQQRVNIKRKVEADFVGDVAGREKAISRALCEHAYGEAVKSLNQNVDKLKSRVEKGELMNLVQIDNLHGKLLDKCFDAYDDFILGASKSDRLRHWRNFKSKARDAFTLIKMRILERKIEISERRVEEVEWQNKVASGQAQLDAMNMNLVELRSENRKLEEEKKTAQGELKAAQSKPKAAQQDDSEECQICMDNIRDTVMMCGHLFCYSCASKLDKCSFCFKKTKRIVRLRK